MPPERAAILVLAPIAFLGSFVYGVTGFGARLLTIPLASHFYAMPLSMAVLVLALLADSALAQQADRPGVAVGDQWQFVVYYAVPSTKPNRLWVITSVSPMGIGGTENGEPLMLTPELNVLESPSHKYSNPKALSFPLEVGKRWRYASDWVFKPKGAKGSSIVDVAVIGHEKVKVPAGEFDAFKLVAKGSLHGVSPINSQYAGETTTTYWYAPAARTIVKSVTHNPYLGMSSVELVEFQLRP
jgi:hypothetical protein